MKVVHQFNVFFSSLGVDWAICGGDAIDLFVGEQTRMHKDLDVTVFWEDRQEIIGFMLKNGWRVFEPDKGKLREITHISNDYRTEDNIWCISKDNKSYNITSLGEGYYDITSSLKNQEKLDFVEFLFNKREEGYFLYKRNHNIKLSLDKAILNTQNRTPYLAPELVLLYKSIFVHYLNSDNQGDQEMVANYRHDFNVVREKLKEYQIKWLKNGLKLSYPNGHEWL